ncbi:MAG: GFA family protein [Rhodoblastus sp.]
MICHCRDCQRASGSAYASLLIVPRDRLAYSGVDPNTMT